MAAGDAAAQTRNPAMPPLDPAFDGRNAPVLRNLREQIQKMTALEKNQLAARRRSKAPAPASVRLEELRNALSEQNVAYVAQLEAAEAVGRADIAMELEKRIRTAFPDTLWRMERRAEANDTRAQATLGGMHRWGLFVAKNEDKACAWYRRAADKGHVVSLYRAALCPEADPKVAAQLLARAAAGGHATAQEMLGRDCLRNKRDAQCALDWLVRAAEQGRAGASSLLGWMYSTGELVPRNEARAFTFVQYAANAGDASAQNNLGQMYEVGRGTAVNGAQAFAWYGRAAQAGLGIAQVNLARAYIEGRGTPPDRETARQWLFKARDQGVGEADKLLQWLEAAK